MSCVSVDKQSLVWCMQTPGPPFLPDEVGVKAKARIIFAQHGATMSSEDNLLMGIKDEQLTTLGDMQASKVAELIMDLQVRLAVVTPVCQLTGTLYFYS